jgi:hypothetical protein
MDLKLPVLMLDADTFYLLDVWLQKVQKSFYNSVPEYIVTYLTRNIILKKTERNISQDAQNKVLTLLKGLDHFTNNLYVLMLYTSHAFRSICSES